MKFDQHATTPSGGLRRRPAARRQPEGRAGSVLALQRLVGNTSTTRLLAGGVVALQRDERGGSGFTMPGPSKHIKGHPDFHRHGEKKLIAGTMRWSLVITVDGMSSSKDPNFPSAKIQIVFTPNVKSGSVSFLQTVARASLDAKQAPQPRLDILPSDYAPFYGADWDPKSLDWKPESAPTGYRSAPSSVSDPSAYLYDEPWAPPTTAVMLESVAVDMRTGAVLGALRWGVGGGRLLSGHDGDCTDQPGGEFAAAVEAFYATPTSGKPAAGGSRFEAIVDEFRGGDATLSEDHRRELDRVASKFTAARADVGERNRRANAGPKDATPLPTLLVAGFGDTMDRDPMDASKRRSDAVLAYFRQAGVPGDAMLSTSFGDKWARAPVSMKEGRNRRVQITISY